MTLHREKISIELAIINYEKNLFRGFSYTNFLLRSKINHNKIKKEIILELNLTDEDF